MTVRVKTTDILEIDVSVGDPVILERVLRIPVSELVKLLEAEVASTVGKRVSRKSKTPESLASRRINYYLSAWISGKWSNGARVYADLEEYIKRLLAEVDVSKLGDKTYRKLVEHNFI